ncbi:MAG: hypothetical protein PHS14_20930, partial [Elusimicrobia bacterium]|nr:hypothetical protein [Elusimicrobiota bacterium]
ERPVTTIAKRIDLAIGHPQPCPHALKDDCPLFEGIPHTTSGASLVLAIIAVGSAVGSDWSEALAFNEAFDQGRKSARSEWFDGAMRRSVE